MRSQHGNTGLEYRVTKYSLAFILNTYDPFGQACFSLPLSDLVTSFSERSRVQHDA